MVKNLPVNLETRVWSLGQEDALEKPGEFHGQRSLVGCRLWGGKEADRTE